MGKKSSDPPDVEAAAEKEGQFSRETARDVTYADRPDQYNPLGSLTWNREQTIDPATGEPVTRWAQTQSFDPRIQQSLDRGMMSIAADPDFDQFGDVVGFDPSAQRAAAEEASFMKSKNRLDQRFADERDSLDVRLRSQGLQPGDQLYDSQMRNFMQGKNDAYEQARLQSVASGRDEFGVMLQGNERANALRDQRIQEYLAKRTHSLGEIAQFLPEGGTA